MYCKERRTLTLITGQEEKGKGGDGKRESGGVSNAVREASSVS